MTNEHFPLDFDCQTAVALLPGYVDGELSEPQAAPLRSHLLACHACRSGAVDHKNLSRWFVADEVVVPDGFAARVARRAFAGDTGNAVTQHAAALSSDSATDSPAEGEGTILPFVLKLTAAAAVLLFGMSLLLGGSSLPSENELSATDTPPWERARLEAEAPGRLDLPAEAADDETETDEPSDGTR